MQSHQANEVSSLWIGDELGPYERLALKSYVDLRFSTTLFTYAEIRGVPNGVTLEDAREIMPMDQRFLNRGQWGLAQHADLFRYRLLASRPSTWVDLDVVALKSDWPSSDYLFALESEGYLGNAILRAPSTSCLVTYLVNVSSESDPKQLAPLEIGPILLSHACKALSLMEYAQPTGAAFPLRGFELWKLFDPALADDVDEVLSNAFSIHLFGGALRFTGAASVRPPLGSWIDRKFSHHEVQPPAGPPVDVEWIRGTLRKKLAGSGGNAALFLYMVKRLPVHARRVLSYYRSSKSNSV